MKIAEEVWRLWEQHQGARLHSGMLNGEPVLVTENPPAPTFLILSQRRFSQLLREGDRELVTYSGDKEYRCMGMLIAVIQGPYNENDMTMEVK